MKRKITTCLLVCVMIVGLLIFLYPTISDQWNTYRQNRLISAYDDRLEQMTPEDYTKEWEAAIAYNNSFQSNTFSGDVFTQTQDELESSEYWSVLNIEGNGVMGYVSIPKINQKIPIYHGTSDEVLQEGSGHLAGTKLPIGGPGNHSVLSAHRGLPSAKLFTDLDQLEVGDQFFVHVLDQTLAYQVDQILPMVDRNDLDALAAAMQIVDGEDYVTLLTCTPYGVNTHRLLVRGHRIEYTGADDNEHTPVETMVESVQNYYLLYILVASAGVFVLLFIRWIVSKMNKSGKNGLKEESDEKDKN